MRTAFAVVLLFVTTPAVLVRAAAGGEYSITDVDVGQLKPGQFIWKPWLAPDGAMSIFVNLQAQRASVYRAGVRIGAATISAGKRRHRTPAGVFRILEKDRVHRSKKYDNAPMPFTLRLTWGGVALHAGIVPGYPTSHGCVHLPRSFARALFYAVPLGTKVVIETGRLHTPQATNRSAHWRTRRTRNLPLVISRMTPRNFASRTPSSGEEGGPLWERRSVNGSPI